MDLLQQVRQTIGTYHMLQKGQTVLCAVSGGADSITLLHLLLRLAKEEGILVACGHVNHGLREAADADEAFVKEICDAWQVPFFLRRVDVFGLHGKEKHLSLEEAARSLRYRALEEMALEAAAARIAVAHNAEDHAETVLLRLFRGSGLYGLSGIGADNGAVIRPLLESSREEILAYIKKQGLSFVTDETNADTAIPRNAVRHRILKEAKERVNPQAVSHIAACAGDAARAGEYLKRCGEEALAQCKKDGEKGARLCFDTDRLRALDPYLQELVVHRALEQTVGARWVMRVHIADICRMVRSDNGNARIILPKGACAVRTHKDLCFFDAGSHRP